MRRRIHTCSKRRRRRTHTCGKARKLLPSLPCRRILLLLLYIPTYLQQGKEVSAAPGVAWPLTVVSPPEECKSVKRGLILSQKRPTKVGVKETY
jgi:hypothetical protein